MPTKPKLTKQPPTKKSLLKSSKSTKHFFFRHKLVITLTILLSLTVLSFANQKYQDWDNARMIKGLAKDFPVLVEQINQETGLNLKPKANCSTTQEKFGEGVSTCELLIAEIAGPETQNKVKDIISRSNIFIRSKDFSNNKGFYLKYNNKNSCDLSFNHGEAINFVLGCITAVRDANTQLALDVFNKIPQQNPTAPNQAR